MKKVTNRIFAKSLAYIKSNPALVIILLVALVLRIWDFPNRYIIFGDSARDAMVAYEGAKQFQLPLVGPFSSLGAFTFGPWYFWILIISGILLPFVYTPWITMTLFSFATVVMAYKLSGVLVKDKKFAVIVALIVALSAFQVQSGLSATNPNLNSFFSFSALYLFFQLLKPKASHWYALFFGLVLGIGISTHYSMIGLALLYPLTLLKPAKKLTALLLSLLGLFIAFLPTLIFDLNNHWFNLKNLLYYYQVGQYNIYLPNRWLLYLGDFWPKFFSETIGIPPVSAFVFIPLTSIMVIYLIIKKRLSRNFVILLIVLAANFVMLRYYRGERSIGYLQYLQPIVIVFFALFIFKLTQLSKQKFTALFVIFAVLIALMLPQTYRSLKSPDEISLLKKDAQTIIDNFPNDRFALYGCESYSSSWILGLSWELSRRGKIADDGRKIAVLDQHCNFPVTLDPKKGPVSVKLLQDPNFIPPFSPLVGINAEDFSPTSDELLQENNWNKYTPKHNFDSVTRWWLKDKLL